MIYDHDTDSKIVEKRGEIFFAQLRHNLAPPIKKPKNRISPQFWADFFFKGNLPGMIYVTIALLFRQVNNKKPFRFLRQKGFLKQLPAYRLDYTLREHGVRHLHEPGDIGAFHVVDVIAFLAVPDTILMDGDHDIVKPLLDFLARP